MATKYNASGDSNGAASVAGVSGQLDGAMRAADSADSGMPSQPIPALGAGPAPAEPATTTIRVQDEEEDGWSPASISLISLAQAKFAQCLFIWIFFS